MKILVVDDEKELRDVVSKYLELEGYDVLNAENGVDAVKLYQDENPDLIILDLMLPDIPGEKICSIVRESKDTPIIMLTSKSSENDKINGLGQGADDYVTKPFSPRELVMRVKAILRRTKRNDNDNNKNIRFGDITINEETHVVKKGNSQLSLTPIEFKILLALSKSPGRIFTRDQLIDYALGFEYEGMSRTIDTHIKNLRHKIEDNPSKPEYILTVFGVGYKFKDK